MATWSLLQNLTDFDFMSVCTDGTDIYFVQFGGGVEYNVFKYDVSGDSISQISNAASWAGTNPQLMANRAGGLTGSAIQFFDGNLYAAVFTTDLTNNFRVFRYDGAGTAWTQVLALTNPGGDAALYTDGTYLIFAPTAEMDFLFDWAQYSSDGSSWSAASVSNTPPPVDVGAGYAQSRSSGTYGPHSPVFVDTASHSTFEDDPDSVFRWFEWSAGAFNISQYTQYFSDGGGWTPADAWLRETDFFRDVLFWTNDSGTWKYAGALGDTPAAPSGGNNTPIITVGSLAQQAGDSSGDFVLLSGGVWGAAETVGSGGLSHLVVLSGGEGFLFGVDGLQAAIWGRSDPFPLPASEQIRFLGLDADQINLYLTANDGTLKLLAYNLQALTLTSTAEFGGATFAEIANRTRGIFPVIKPGNDGVLFARGRDGNNNQVLLSDDYGATFGDVSDAGWATDKYCVGLRPDPLRPDDLAACFADNDLYRSQDGATTWAKAGDAPATLRAAARHSTTPLELMLGAQAEDTIYFTDNLGVSFEDVSDAALGTVNVIEVSR